MNRAPAHATAHTRALPSRRAIARSGGRSCRVTVTRMIRDAAMGEFGLRFPLIEISCSLYTLALTHSSLAIQSRIFADYCTAARTSKPTTTTTNAMMAQLRTSLSRSFGSLASELASFASHVDDTSHVDDASYVDATRSGVLGVTWIMQGCGVAWEKADVDRLSFQGA